MITYNFDAFYSQMRVYGDWSNPVVTAFPYRAAIGAPPGKASIDQLGHLNREGVVLQRFGIEEDLSDQMVIVTRMKWADPVSGVQKWADLIWIGLHVYEEINGEQQLVGFDDIYIPLGGTPLPTFETTQDWLDFRQDVMHSIPPRGPFVPGASFEWASAIGLQSILGSADGETITGSVRGDEIAADMGNDVVKSLAGDDVVRGGAGRDRLVLGDGNDRGIGDAGNDVLLGGNGNDTLSGGKGLDTLDGGTGNDILNGGDGADSFVFGVGYGSDRVTDFNVAEGDRLRLDDALWGGEPLDAFDVVMQFATFPQTNDRVIFTFAGGERIVLIEDTADGLIGLHAAIDII